MTPDTNLLNDEIDIRELLRTLFRYKWVILGITVFVAVVVLIYSKFGTPKTYAAQAQVIFTKPLFTTNLDTSIQNTPQTPEASIVKDLALDDSLVRNVYTSADVSEVLGKDVDFTQFKANMSAKLTGTSKLYLVVLAKDPKTATLIVNVWASQFIAQINALYSVNENSLTLINNEVQDAHQKVDAAEQALQQNMPDVNTKKIVLANDQNTLAAYLNTLTQLDAIISDTHSLTMSLTIWPAESKLSIEYQISLISLYQRAAGGLADSQLQGIQTQGLQPQGMQIQIAVPSVDNTRTVGEANASLVALENALVDQKEKLQVSVEKVKQEIIIDTLQLESANYQLTQLTTERDLAQDSYKALTTQMGETQINTSRVDVVAKLVGQALPPEKPISNRTLIKTLIAGAAAFAFSCFGVLFINWWKSPG